MKQFCLVIVCITLLATAAGCDSSPQLALTATPAAVPTATSVAPTATSSSAPSAPTETPCTTPSVTSHLNLLPLPGSVRGTTGMTMLQGHLYVAGTRSNNVGVIENGQLSKVFPVFTGPSALAADDGLGRLFVLNSADLTVSMSDGQQVQTDHRGDRGYQPTKQNSQMRFRVRQIATFALTRPMLSLPAGFMRANTGNGPTTILKYDAKLLESERRRFVGNKPVIPSERVKALMRSAT